MKFPYSTLWGYHFSCVQVLWSSVTRLEAKEEIMFGNVSMETRLIFLLMYLRYKTSVLVHVKSSFSEPSGPVSQSSLDLVLSCLPCLFWFFVGFSS